jgi:hypothetical protein
MSKHLEFNELVVKPARKTKVFEVRSKFDGFFLGSISWHDAWRQYVFEPTKEKAIWSSDCLIDLAEFIKSLMEERRIKKQKGHFVKFKNVAGKKIEFWVRD